MYWGKPLSALSAIHNSSEDRPDKIAKDIDDQFLPITVLEEIKAAAAPALSTCIEIFFNICKHSV
jgi:hypothetical protein